MQRILLVFFDAGGGHRAAAGSLAEAIGRQRRPWAVETLNLDEVLEPIDPIHRTIGIRSPELYNWTLRKGWTLGSPQIIPMMHRVIRLLHPKQVALLRAEWRSRKPDLVVSLIPHYNRAIFESLAIEWPRVPLVTILTDLADYPPHFWLEPQEQHFICGSDLAVRQAETLAANARRIWRVSGMIIHPRFYDSASPDRVMQLRRLGLQPGTPTGLVSFGGYGSAQMLPISERLSRATANIQLILLCGRNARLQSSLQALKLRFPVHVQGFADNVAHFMALSDFFIGKPGPGSVSEALAMRLPVIVVHGSRTMAQERYNIHWIRQQGVGEVVLSIRDIPGAVERILPESRRQLLLQRIDSLNNRAVFEIPEILERILAESAPHSNGPRPFAGAMTTRPYPAPLA